MRVFIVDDEAPARERLRELLEDIAGELPTVVVGEARNGLEALERLPASGAQVLLADIQMPGMGGLELARHLAALEQPPAVVFVTAHERHAVEAFELNALDYLLKPVRAAIRGFERSGGDEEPHWVVLLEGVEERLPVSRRQWALVKELVSER